MEVFYQVNMINKKKPLLIKLDLHLLHRRKGINENLNLPILLQSYL